MANNAEDEIRQQCRAAADMVADALMMAGLLVEAHADQAVEIVEEELLVRKAMGKL